MSGIFQIVIEKYNAYWGDGRHLFLLILALLYIIVAIKKKDVENTLLAYVGIFAVVFALPITAGIIQKLIGASVYWRMFWILPTSIIIALAFTHLTEALKTKWLKPILVMVLAVLIAVTGTWIYTNERFVSAANWHKLPASVPEICELIQTDAKEQGQMPKAVVVNSLAPSIRQYDAGIKLLYGRDAMRGENPDYDTQVVYYQMQQEIPDYAELDELFRKTKCNYLVWTGSEESFVGFEEQGYRLVGQVNEYKIYFIV